MRLIVGIVVILTVVVAGASLAQAQNDYQRMNAGGGRQLGSAWLGSGQGGVTAAAMVGQCSSCGGRTGICPTGPYRQTCLRCQSHCCDKIWDGYCEEKARKLERWAKQGYWESPVICLPKFGLRCRGGAPCGDDCVGDPTYGSVTRVENPMISMEPVVSSQQIDLLQTEPMQPTQAPNTTEQPIADTPTDTPADMPADMPADTPELSPPVN